MFFNKNIKLLKLLVAIVGLPLVYLFVTREVIMYAVVDGRSMDPTYYNGDVVSVTKMTLWFHGPRPNDVVLIREFNEFGKGDGKIDLKRVMAVTNNMYYVLGDNTNRGASFDSRNYGALHRNQILAISWR